MTSFINIIPQKACPVCRKAFSLDRRIVFSTTRVYLSPYAKYLADIHVEISHCPRELAKLTVAKDPEGCLPIWYFVANYLGTRFVERRLLSQVNALRQNHESLGLMMQEACSDRRQSS